MRQRAAAFPGSSHTGLPEAPGTRQAAWPGLRGARPLHHLPQLTVTPNSHASPRSSAVGLPLESIGPASAVSAREFGSWPRPGARAAAGAASAQCGPTEGLGRHRLRPRVVPVW